MNLVHSGKQRIAWAEKRMPVLRELVIDLEKSQPFRDVKVAACLHITKETAVFIRYLARLGADACWGVANPLSTQDDVVMALRSEGFSMMQARKGMSVLEYYDGIRSLLNVSPHLIVDDGGDLAVAVLKNPDFSERIVGGTEKTTAGVRRLRRMEREGVLPYPAIAVNDSFTKRNFDNVYGTGQSVIEGILRKCPILLSGKVVVVAGYGYCGKGLAKTFSGLGSRVIVTEVNPVVGLQAVMDGFEVLPMAKALLGADIVVTVTGMKDVVGKRHFSFLKTGVILCNAGHGNCEVAVEDFNRHSISFEDESSDLRRYILPDSKIAYVLGEGRLVNLVCAEGHPPEVMDLSFANQLMALLELWIERKKNCEKTVRVLSDEFDEKIASLKLKHMKIDLDEWTDEQNKYNESYFSGCTS